MEMDSRALVGSWSGQSVQPMGLMGRHWSFISDLRAHMWVSVHTHMHTTYTRKNVTLKYVDFWPRAPNVLQVSSVHVGSDFPLVKTPSKVIVSFGNSQL